MLLLRIQMRALKFLGLSTGNTQKDIYVWQL